MKAPFSKEQKLERIYDYWVTLKPYLVALQIFLLVLWAAWEFRVLQSNNTHSLIYEASHETENYYFRVTHEYEVRIDEVGQAVYYKRISPRDDEVRYPALHFFIRREHYSSAETEDVRAQGELSSLFSQYLRIGKLEDCIVYSLDNFRCNDGSKIGPGFDDTLAMDEGEWKSKAKIRSSPTLILLNSLTNGRITHEGLKARLEKLKEAERFIR